MILSRRVLTGDRVVDVEPSLAGAAEPTIVWSVVFVDRSSAAPVIARTFLIPDGGGPFTEMTLEGRVPVAQPAPS
jgi:hypothetical protein